MDSSAPTGRRIGFPHRVENDGEFARDSDAGLPKTRRRYRIGAGSVVE
jgi:hypothetical protein